MPLQELKCTCTCRKVAWGEGRRLQGARVTADQLCISLPSESAWAQVLKRQLVMPLQGGPVMRGQVLPSWPCQGWVKNSPGWEFFRDSLLQFLESSPEENMPWEIDCQTGGTDGGGVQHNFFWRERICPVCDISLAPTSPRAPPTPTRTLPHQNRSPQRRGAPFV